TFAAVESTIAVDSIHHLTGYSLISQAPACYIRANTSPSA
ncbi:MAG: hypothetical protein ACI90G_002082, partial [Urechidicola sp.]